MELSSFKYKRRCSIFKEDFETPIESKKEVLKNSSIKLNVKYCDESKGIVRRAKKKPRTNSPVKVVESTSRKDNGIESDMKSTPLKSSLRQITNESPDLFETENQEFGNVTGEPDGSRCTTVVIISDGDSSCEEEDAEHELGKLKEKFNGAFSNNNGIDPDVLVLLDAPTGKQQESNPEKMVEVVDSAFGSTFVHCQSPGLVMELSSFKYKRRCSIFKEDFETPIESKKEVLKNSSIKLNVKYCDESKGIVRRAKKKPRTNSPVKVVESTSRKDNGIESDMKSTPLKSSLRQITNESPDLFETEYQEFGNVTGEPDGSRCTTVVIISDGDSSCEEEDAEHELGKLKEKFNGAFSNNNGIDPDVLVLLDAPTGKQQESNPEKMVEVGKNGSQCSFHKVSKGQQRFTSSEALLEMELSSYINLEDISPTKNSKESWINLEESCYIVDDPNDEKRLKKLKNLFPGHKDEELLNVLEFHGGSLDDAVAAMEAFSSPKQCPKKTACKIKTGKQERGSGANEVIIIDDHNDSSMERNTSSANSSQEIMSSYSDDEDETYSHSEQDDCEMSSGERAEVLSLLDSSELSDVALVKGCSWRKAAKIASLRPFEHWNDLVEKLKKNKGFNEEFLWECLTFINERNKMEKLINECETVSNDLKSLFEVPTDKSEEPSESQPQLVLKEQYRTKMPSIVAPGFKLKPYQFTGLNWLIAIHKKDVNGILADEMGLGKTIQTIVFLAHLIERGENGPHLIVVPSSTGDNWKHELEQWCPSIHCLIYTGSQEERRAIRDEVNYEPEHDFQIVLTTYSMAISSAADRSFLRKLHFHYGVFDEAHMLKNMKSQRYQFLLRIQPQRMLLLTGTPIQNNMLELMSLLAFLMPTMFAERLQAIKLFFGDDKNKGDGKESSRRQEQVLQVRKIMEPFVMRRLKKDVLSQLSAKYDHTVEIELPTQQRKIYHDTYTSCAKIINSADGKRQFSQFSQLSGLCIQLRKAANHALLLRDYYNDDKLLEMAQKYCRDPAHRDCEVNLVFEDMQVMSDFELNRLCLDERRLKEYELPHELIMESGKFIYLDSVLPNMKKRGDRVLLFSQFTMMMDIAEVYLQTRNHKYLRLDGSTVVSERQDLIDQFNTDNDIFIFLLSTKAGGLGINLTAANVVIISDIDVNPHNDKQAEDRCHRLGQTREVNVYRLITKETIEEAMLKLANDKIRLHEDLSGQSKEGNKASDMNDIQAVMQAVFGQH